MLSLLFASLVLAATPSTKVCGTTLGDTITLNFATGEAMVNNIAMNISVLKPENGAVMNLLLTPSPKSPAGYFVTYHLQQWSNEDGYATMQQQGHGRDIGGVTHLTCK
jgi:hypothetical protein